MTWREGGVGGASPKRQSRYDRIWQVPFTTRGVHTGGTAANCGRSAAARV